MAFVKRHDVRRKTNIRYHEKRVRGRKHSGYHKGPIGRKVGTGLWDDIVRWGQSQLNRGIDYLRGKEFRNVVNEKLNKGKNMLVNKGAELVHDAIGKYVPEIGKEAARNLTDKTKDSLLRKNIRVKKRLVKKVTDPFYIKGNGFSSEAEGISPKLTAPLSSRNGFVKASLGNPYNQSGDALGLGGGLGGAGKRPSRPLSRNMKALVNDRSKSILKTLSKGSGLAVI